MTRKPASPSKIRRFQRPEPRFVARPEASAAPEYARSPTPERPREQHHETASPSSYSSGGAEAPVGVAEFGDILRRRWITIAATTAIITTLGVAFAFLAKPQFLATTSIFVDPRNRASFQIEGTGTGGSYDPNLVDSQIVLIESDTVLRRVISAEKLLQDAEFAKGPGSAEFNVMRNLKEAVKVKRPDRTYVVEVQVRSQSGEKSARIANAIAAAYLSDGRDSKSETANREQTWLDRHLKNLQDRLKDAEAKVESYKVENKILGVGSVGVGPDRLLLGEQQLSELNRGIVEAQRRASEAKSVMDQVDQLRRSGKLPDTTNDALRSGVIERLRTQLSEVLRLEANARSTLGPLHPAATEIREQVSETRRQINEELNRIAEGARSAYSVARANVTALERQLDGLKRDATSTNQTLLRLRELERAVEAQKAVYEKFLRDKEQIARLTVDTPAGRVIAPAVAPSARSFPNRPLIAALAFIGGLFSGIGLALVLETLSRARHGNRVGARGNWQGLSGQAGGGPPLPPGGPPFMAMMPAREAPSRRFGFGARIANSNSADAMPSANSSYGKDIWRLAGDIGSRLGHGRVATLLISGLKAGSGQPQLTAHMGQALAELGWKVLLIDGTGAPDGLASLLPAASRIVELRSGQRSNITLEVAEGIFLLPFGGVKMPPSRQRPPFIGDCDVILIDGPAVGTAALERLDLAHRIDGVIAILPEGEGQVQSAMETLDRRFGRALMGVVGRAA